ncbi:MAG: traC [Betaproteobacteria bacterium]|nr:traC [Betaproteobacteria bacterium]
MWGEIDASKVQTDWTGLDELERDRIRASRDQLDAREREKRAERELHASRRGVQQWKDGSKTKPEGVETYLDRKGVQHEAGIRYARADGTVLVPMIRYDIALDKQAEENYTGPRRFVGLQKIAPDGTKRFNKGVSMEGAACRLGAAPKAGELVLVTEGLATGLTLRMATGNHAVFVGFNAGNLPRVAEILRKVYPKNAFLICADDDAYLVSSLNKLLRENYGAADIVLPPVHERALNTKHGPGLVSAEYVADADGVQGIVGALRYNERTHMLSRQNAGRTYAHRAAAAAGNATVVYPRFRDRPLILPAEPDLVDKLTDFNDLHNAEGLEAVRAQLGAEISRYELSAQVQKMVDERLQETKKRKAKAGADKDKPPPRAIDWARLSRYTLIYPTDTLWDAEYRQIVKLSAVKIDSGDAAVNAWLRSPGRRTVNADQVVFDPGSTCSAECINLFNGMPMKPCPDGSYLKILQLLQYLCGEAEQDHCPILDWVLRWLAYPLQHPGAKMQTAIVMHGAAEGTGKNLFFRAMQEIYGEYAGLITQAELESPYNAWISRKLFIVANEVISRAEMKHHVGRLKNYITEPFLPITEKYLPARYEQNHMNMVFLTNDLHALQLSPRDRRYTVIRTPGALPAAYYKDVAAELEAGGAAAFYYYLMNLPLGEFKESTQPLLTLAKEELIEQSYNSVQYFQVQLKSGEIGNVPYGPCLMQDCYALYLAWCPRVGHRNPLPENRFSTELAAMNGVRHVRKARVIDPDRPEERTLVRSLLKQKAIFEMGVRPEDRDENQWRDEGIAVFRESMQQYLRGRRSRSAGEQGLEGHGDAAGW